jgi:hypothetical protein
MVTSNFKKIINATALPPSLPNSGDEQTDGREKMELAGNTARQRLGASQ